MKRTNSLTIDRTAVSRMLFLAAALLALLIPCSFGAGVTSSEFLLIGVGAGQQGMSGACTAITSDVNSIYWNQAGLGLVAKPQVSCMYNAWLGNIGYNYAAAAFPSRFGTFGVSIHYLASGDIEGRESQVSAPYSFGASDTMIAVGFGRRMNRHALFGMTLKHIRSQIESVSAQAYAMDAGFMYQVPGSQVSAGIAMHNLGTTMKFVSESENLPLDLACGVGYRIGGVLLGFDVKQYVYEGTSEVSFGTEFVPLGILTLRGGLLYNALSARSTRARGTDALCASGGFGLNLGSNQLDYAFTPFGELGSSHKVSFLFKF